MIYVISYVGFDIQYLVVLEHNKVYNTKQFKQLVNKELTMLHNKLNIETGNILNEVNLLNHLIKVLINKYGFKQVPYVKAVFLETALLGE